MQHKTGKNSQKSSQQTAATDIDPGCPPFKKGMYNQIDAEKQQYVLNMRKEMLSEQDIITEDGYLNVKYFNVKKGQYWSKRETEKLIEGVLKHGVTNFKEIKQDKLEGWSETEIRLRICRLLKCYNLNDYTEPFESKEQIFEEAQKNKKHAMSEQIEDKSKKIFLGGIYYNPPKIEGTNMNDTFVRSFFNAKKNEE